LIEIADGRFKPYEMGTGGTYLYNNVVCHVLAEDSMTAVKVADYLGMQKEKTIFIYDTNLLAVSGTFPLTQQGMVTPNALTFPALVQDFPAGFKWRKLRFSDANIQPLNTINRGLFQKPIKFETEVVITTM
jgi:hypothetical protein